MLHCLIVSKHSCFEGRQLRMRRLRSGLGLPCHCFTIWVTTKLKKQFFFLDLTNMQILSFTLAIHTSVYIDACCYNQREKFNLSYPCGRDVNLSVTVKAVKLPFDTMFEIRGVRTRNAMLMLNTKS